MSLTLNAKVLKKYMADVFVETGTYDGRGAIFAVFSGFKAVHTIEVDPGRARAARLRLGGFPEVTLHVGDSIDLLPKILSTMDRKALIFLDAHSFGRGPSRTGRLKYPLMEELRRIAQASKRKDHNVLIDDIRSFKLFGTTVEEVKGLLSRINPSYRIAVEPNVNNDPDMIGAQAGGRA